VNHHSRLEGLVRDRLATAMALLLRDPLMNSVLLRSRRTLGRDADDKVSVDVFECWVSLHTVRTLSLEDCDSNSETFPKGLANAAIPQ